MSATLHALPTCPVERIFELRRAARDTGARFTLSKPRPAPTTPAPFDPNGGRAA